MKKILAVILILCLAVPKVSAAAWSLEDGVIISGKTDAKKIALTFDDGPHPSKTDKILDLLKEYQVHATFFVIGQNVAVYPKVVLREIEEGHEVGNHTYSHKSLAQCKKDVVEKEIISTEENQIAKPGNIPREYRPPECAST